MKAIRSFKEDGMVLAKFIKPAYEGGTIDGKTIPATPERSIVLFITSSKFDTVNGYANGSVEEYAISPETYTKVSFGDPVRVEYEMTIDGNKSRTKVVSAQFQK